MFSFRIYRNWTSIGRRFAELKWCKDIGMKRCGIFVFYNKEGKVEPYVEVLLKSICRVTDQLTIVVNGIIADDGVERLKRYSANITSRENIGFDGGAYKDIFLDMPKEDLKKWDEILLVNDTFYGAFYPLEKVFGIMDGTDCDFWGLSCHSGGRSGLFGDRVISPHVQSYFIVMKKKMFMHPLFQRFWEEMPYPTSFKEAVLHFEIHFSKYFVELGFHFTSWMDVQSANLGVKSNQDAIDEMIIKLRFPVLKKKSYTLFNYIGFKRLFGYLAEETEFPVEVIYEDIAYRSEKGLIHPYNPLEVLRFCNTYKRIYLYGMGRYAKNLEIYLNDNGIVVAGYLVTKADELSDNVFVFADFIIEPDMGIIVAVNKKNLEEIRENLKNSVLKEQIMLPQFR